MGNGIQLSTNFDLNANLPLDSRITVSNQSDRNNLVSSGLAYPGLITYITGENKYYYYNIYNQWDELKFDSQESILYISQYDSYSSLILNPTTYIPGRGISFRVQQDLTRPSVYPYPNYHYTGINNFGTEIYFNTGEMRWFYNLNNVFVAKSPITSLGGPSFSAFLPLTEWVYYNNTPISGFKLEPTFKHSISHAKTGTDSLNMDLIGAVSLDSEQIISGQKYFIGNSFLKTGSFFQDNIGLSQLYSGANPLNRFIYTGWSPSGFYIKLNKGSFVNVSVTGSFGGYFVRWFSSNNVNGPYNYFDLLSGSTLIGRLNASGVVSGHLPINDNLLFFEGTPNGGGDLRIRVSGDYGYYSGNKFGFGNLEPVADFDFIGSTKIDGNLHLTKRPTINNSVLLISGDQNIVYTTGNQSIQGVKNFGTRPTFYSDPFVLSTELSSATINTVKTTGTQFITGDKIFKNNIYFLSDGSFIKQSSFYQALGGNSFNPGFSTIPINAQFNYTGWAYNNSYIELSRGSPITVIFSGAGGGWGVRWYSSTGVNGPWTNFTLYSGVGATPVTGITILGTNSVQTATGFLRRDHKYLAFNAGAGGGGNIYLTVSGDYGYYSGNKFGFGTDNPDEQFHIIGTTKIEGRLLITGTRPTVNGSGVLLQGEAGSGLKWRSIIYDNQFGGATAGFAGRNGGGELVLYGTGQQTSVPSFYGWNGFSNDSFTASTARTNLGLTSTATQPENTFIRTTGDQTISGVKKFINGMLILSPQVELKNTLYDNGIKIIGYRENTEYYDSQSYIYLNESGDIEILGANDPSVQARKIELRSPKINIIAQNEGLVLQDGYNESTKIVISGGDINFNKRPLINGTGVLLSGEAAQVDLSSTVQTTGNQQVSGTKTFITNSVLYSGVNVNFDKNTNVKFSGTPVFISGINSNVLFENQNSNFNFTSSMNSKMIFVSGNSNITGTLPLNLTNGYNVSITQMGTGKVVFTGVNGVSIRQRLGLYSTAGRYAVASLLHMNNNEFILYGDLT